MPKKRIAVIAATFLIVISVMLTAGILLKDNSKDVENTESKNVLGKYYYFDFGSGEVYNGFKKVTKSTVYNRDRGYGFADTKGLKDDNGNEPNALHGDSCYKDGSFEFKVDLPNDEYYVSVTVDCGAGPLSMEVLAEGTTKINKAMLSASKVITRNFNVTVNDGQLNLVFEGTNTRINALEISTAFNFEFGNVENSEKQYIPYTTVYDAEVGYGFSTVEDESGKKWSGFNVDLPNGDYYLTMSVGNSDGNTEDLEVMIENAVRLTNTAKKGSFMQQSLTVALYDGQLNFMVTGSVENIKTLKLIKLAHKVEGEKPTVYIAGDSTVASYNASSKPQAGWGQMISNYFTDEVVFVNNAIGGRSSKSFVKEGRLDSILTNIKPGDYLLIQFGHNDASVGNETRYAAPYTTYKKYLKMFVDGARANGATPVLITPVGRRSYDSEGKFKSDFPDYVAAMKQVAQEENVKLIDLTQMSIDYFNSIGVEATKDVFLWAEPGEYSAFPDGVQDNTHFQEYGAEQIAGLVVKGIKELNLPIAKYIKQQ